MFDIEKKYNNALGSEGRLFAEEVNAVVNELEQAVRLSGQTLNEADDKQLTRSIDLFVKHNIYIDNGTVNNINLKREGLFTSIETYTDGSYVFFSPLFDNTDIVKVQINSLGQKDLLLNGEQLTPGRLRKDRMYLIGYNEVADVFELKLFSTLDDELVSNLSKSVISSYIVKTVASETTAIPSQYDFTNLHDALNWLMASRPSTNTNVVFDLDQGNHILVPEAFPANPLFNAYYVLNNIHLTLNMPSATIRIGTAFANGKSLFRFNNSDITVNNGTINMTHLNASTTGIDINNGVMKFNQTTVINTNILNKGNGITINNGLLYGVNSTFNGFNTALILSSGARVDLSNVNNIVNNCNLGIAALEGPNSRTVIHSGIFSNNAANTDISTNVEHNNGSIITISDSGYITSEYDGSVSGLLATTEKDAIDELANRFVDTGIVKTVASTDSAFPENFDFPNLHTALRWVESKDYSKSSKLTLALEDGVHVIGGQGEYDDQAWTYYTILNGYVTLSSISGQTANCTITLDSWDDSWMYPTIFTVTKSGSLELKNVTFDLTLAGYPYNREADFIVTNYGGYVKLDRSTIKNVGNGVYVGTQGQFYGYIFTIENCGWGINADYASGVKAVAGTFNNNNFGIYVNANYPSSVLTYSCTYTGNTTDTSIPLNIIQPSGSFISDRTHLELGYDNSISGLTANTTKKAIDEIVNLIGSEAGNIDNKLVNNAISKTVASVDSVDPSVFDFTSLHDALRWLETLHATGREYITLELDDGTHVLGGNGEFDTNLWTYYSLNGLNVLIKSITDIKANCIITLDAFDDGDNWPYIFWGANSSISFSQVTLDMSLNGYPYPQNVTLLSSSEGTLFSTNQVVINNTGYPLYQHSGGYSKLAYTTIDNAVTGIWSSGSKCYIRNSTLSNCSSAVYVNASGKVILDTVTFTTNIVDSNIPLDEVQTDGSVIDNIDNTTYSIVNGFVVHPDGTIEAANAENAEIAARGGKALITKEYFEANADGASQLEIITENTQTGYRILGRTPANYGDIGVGAIDLSESTEASTINGATGEGAFAHGLNVIAKNARQVVLGKYNTGASVDTLVEIGIGVDSVNRKNGFELYLNGTIKLPEATIANIDALGDKALITKEYLMSKAPTVAQLLKITEATKTGYRLLGEVDTAYTNTGEHAVDFSFADGTSESFGASGDYSFAAGRLNKALGIDSAIFGKSNTASQGSIVAGESNNVTGIYSLAFGLSCSVTAAKAIAGGEGSEAKGIGSIAIGTFVKAINNYQTVFGKYNIGTSVDTILELGVGIDDLNRKNALEVYKDGTVVTPDTTKAMIDSRSPRTLVTREYVTDLVGVASQLDKITENNKTGWRILGRNPDLYGDIGSNAIDLSVSTAASIIMGATGDNSFVIGTDNEVSGSNAFGAGTNNKASGLRAFVTGYANQVTNSNGVAFGRSVLVSGANAFGSGYNSKAEGTSSFAGNSGHAVGLNATAFGASKAINDYQFTLGKYNVGVSVETILEIGIGTDDANRKNAMEVYLDGTITLPEATISEIKARGPKALITQEFISETTVTDSVVKTVAGPLSINPETFDFQSLHDALRWIEMNNFVAGGEVTLSLDNGIHILGGQGEFDANNWCYYNLLNANVIIKSTASNSDLCSITLDSWDDSNNWPALFAVQGGRLEFSHVTIDPSIDGYPYPSNVDITASNLSKVTFQSSTISNFGGIWAKSSYLYVSSITIDNAKYAINALLDTYALVINSQISNCDKTFECFSASKIVFGSVTLTNNTTDFNIPLNEIQHTGEYISDGTGLSHVYNNTISGLTATTEKEAIDELESKKSDVGHHHIISDVDGLNDALDLKLDIAVPVEETALTSYQPDLLTDTFFEYTLDQDAKLENPRNVLKGRSGKIIIAQDAIGGRVLTYGNYYNFPAGVPDLNTEPNAYNVFNYTVLSVTCVLLEFMSDFVPTEFIQDDTLIYDNTNITTEF